MSEPNVTPKPNIATPEAQATLKDVAGKELTDEQAAEMISKMSGNQLLELARRIDAVKEEQNKKAADSQKPRYYTSTEFGDLKEKDIYNFDHPIRAIENAIPDFLDVHLSDPNMVPRWINKDPRRLGQAIAEGWSYITRDDLAEPMKIQVADSADGHYVYADVVAMKLSKEKVYGRIRANFLKSLAITKSSLALHEHMKNIIKTELASGPEGDRFQKYSQTNAIGVYSPLAGA